MFGGISKQPYGVLGTPQATAGLPVSPIHASARKRNTNGTPQAQQHKAAANALANLGMNASTPIDCIDQEKDIEGKQD